MTFKSIDIFCDIIDNYGDIGFCYRLAREFLNYNNQLYVKLIVNSKKEYSLMENNKNTIYEKISIVTYDELLDNKIIPADIIIESFGCEIPLKYLKALSNNSKLIINLEYLSFETWTKDFHLQKSPQNNYKIEKVFYMPGIGAGKGGLLLDEEFIKNIEKVRQNKLYYRKKYNIGDDIEIIGTIFSYKKDFSFFLDQLNNIGKKTMLFIFDEKKNKNFKNVLENKNRYDKIKFLTPDFIPYNEYEELISLADFNLVRGEDSFVRALLLGSPFLWHIYRQDENVHLKKLEAFLEIYTSNDKIKKLFLSYNKDEEEDYDYFFKNLKELTKYNQDFSKKIIKNDNLIKKLIEYIEKI